MHGVEDIVDTWFSQQLLDIDWRDIAHLAGEFPNN
jgi:hypothetical protein